MTGRARAAFAANAVKRRQWSPKGWVLASLAVGVLGGLVQPGARTTASTEPLLWAEHRFERPPQRPSLSGAVWDLDVGPSFARIDALGASLGHLRPGLHPDINELNGNLTKKFGPLYFNSLGHNDLAEGDTVARIVQQRDKFLYGSPGTFNLGLYDMFLFDEGVDPASGSDAVTTEQRPVKVILDDRTLVTFAPTGDGLTRGQQDPNGYLATPFIGAQLQYKWDDPWAIVNYDDGTRYAFRRVTADPNDSPCDYEWNERRLTWADSAGAIGDYLRHVREGRNRIYALTRIEDRFGNRIEIERRFGTVETSLCRINRVVEYEKTDTGATQRYVTRMGYTGYEADGTDFTMLKSVTFFEGTPDAKTYELTHYFYPDHRYRRPPHLLALAFGDLSDPEQSVVTCFQHIFPNPDGILRSVEGPYVRARRPATDASGAATGHCHPNPPSSAASGAQQPVGPTDVYAFDLNGRLREVIEPNGAGLMLWFNPQFKEVTLFHTWPMRVPAMQGHYERDEHTDGPAVRQESIIATLHVSDDDGIPKVVRRTDPYGRYWSFDRNPAGYVRVVDSFDGQRTTIEYEEDDPESPFAAIARPLPYRITDVDGRVQELRYDGYGRVTRVGRRLPDGTLLTSTETRYHETPPLAGTVEWTQTTGSDPVTGEEVKVESATILVGVEDGFYHVASHQNGVESHVYLDAAGQVSLEVDPFGVELWRERQGNREEMFLVDPVTERSRSIGAVTVSETLAPVRFEDPYGLGTTEVRYNGRGQIEALTSPLEHFDVEYQDTHWSRISRAPMGQELEDQRASVGLRRDHACALPTGRDESVGGITAAELTIDYQSNDCGIPNPPVACPDLRTPSIGGSSKYARCTPRDGGCPEIREACVVVENCVFDYCTCDAVGFQTAWDADCVEPYPTSLCSC